jgi:uncharacterized protein with GYD domain
MSQYVVRLVHTPDQCPSSNSKIRDRMIKGSAEIPRLAEKLGIRFVAGPLVLAAEHEGIAVVETDRPEAIHEFILQSGLMQWNSVRVTPAQTLQDAMKDLERVPTPLY